MTVGDPTVLVLLSTFNGESFLEEQLVSVLNQRGVLVAVSVRDDGSTDGTIPILEDFSKRDQRIRYWRGRQRLGPAGSFLELARRASADYQYYAYCDQDDVWYEDKLLRGTESLATLSEESLGLYCSSYDVVDRDLAFLCRRDIYPEIPMTMEATIIERCPSACTMMMNRALFLRVASSRPPYVRMHDYWTLLLAEALGGQVVLDGRPSMMYRQQGNNAVGFTSDPPIKRLPKLVRKAINSPRERSRQVASLLDEVKADMLNDDIRKTLHRVTHYTESIRDWIGLLLDPAFRTPTPGATLLARMALLFRVF